MRCVSVSGIYQCRDLPLEYVVTADGVRGPDHYVRTIEEHDERGNVVSLTRVRESARWIKDALATTNQTRTR